RALPFETEYGVQMASATSLRSLVGPTIVPASSMFEKQPQRTSTGFGDPETAARWVEKEALVGAKWIKIYNSMDETSLAAIVATATKLGLKVFGHAHDVPPLRASDLGMSSIEHITEIPLSCLAEGVTLDRDRHWAGLASLQAWLWSHVDAARCRSLMDRFKKNGTAWVPTLGVSEAMMSAGGHDGRPEP